MNPQARTSRGPARLEFGFDGVSQTHQNDICIRAGGKGSERSGHRDVWPVISPHTIDGDRYIH